MSIGLFDLTYSEVTVAIVILFIMATSRWKVLQLFYNNNTWAVVAVLLCFIMVSGYTWNKMRKPVFSHKTNDGPVFISSGQKKQYLAESYIVAVLNGTIVLGMILAIEGAGGVRGDRRGRKRQVLQMAGIGLMLASFAVLLATFRIKRPWYPYSF